MAIHKLTSTDAFISFDLEDAPSVGVVRSAKKILQGGAGWLARSLTYSFATYEIPKGGASAGINAETDARSDAVAAFVGEIEPMVSEGRFLPSPSKGVDAAAFAPLRAIDSRPAALWAETDGISLEDELTAVGCVAAATSSSGGDLGGKNIMIEGFGPVGLSIARQATERGAKIVGVATGAGAAAVEGGVDVATLSEAWAAHGDKLVDELGVEKKPGWAAFGTDADILFTGSKAGAMNHQGAEQVKANVVVPSGPVPLTTKALIVLQRNDKIVVPDFVCLAGPLLAAEAGDQNREALLQLTTESVDASLDEISLATNGDNGLFLRAAKRAEAFLSSWQDTLPFGRPLAP